MTASNIFTQFVQGFYNATSKQFIKSPPVKGLGGLTIKWEDSKLTSTAYSEESDFFFYIF